VGDNERVESDVELIARTFQLLDARTYEQSLDHIDENFVMVTPAGLASEPDTYRGRDGVRRWWESFIEVMDSVRLETLEVEDIGDGRAIISFVIHARGKSSGIDAEQRAFAIGSTANGKVTGLEFFATLEQARAAARA
jgi:ketosteroid isomerase-like protein